MWCAACHQDVPAVARSAREPLVCPRCRCELEPATAEVSGAAGILLSSFDGVSNKRLNNSASEQDSLASPIDWMEQEQAHERLRAINWKLQAPPQLEPSLEVATRRVDPFVVAEVPLRSVAKHAKTQAVQNKKLTKTSWLLSLLLGTGVVCFFTGLGLLGWSVAFELPLAWQQGMTLTIAAEGLLILSLTWMAVRLWRSGRLMNRQLCSVDQQLAEIEKVTGTLAGQQHSSSQHFYHHFSQAASPHMSVANLQGQVDQLAARVAG